MGISIKVGDPIPLRLLTENRVTDRFVRAIIRDSVGAEITGSPANVPHLANGFYSSDAINMPSTDHITVEYDVFDDAGFTTPSDDLFPDSERFDLDELGTAIDELLAAATKGDMVATVSDEDNLKAQVSDQDALSASVSDDDEIKAVVSDLDAIGAQVSDNESIGGSVDC